MNQKGKRIEWIDSIRCIAAMLVVFHHYWGSLGVSLLYPKAFDFVNLFITGIFDAGKIGVVLFFYISGFVIPFSLLRYRNRNITCFGISRFFRLYPLYWLSIALVLLILRPSINLTQVLANVTMFQKFVGIEDLLGVYWTLQIELVFYIICAFLFKLKLLKKEKTAFWAVYISLGTAFVLALLRYVLVLKLPVALPLSLAVMFMGYLWGKFLRGEGNIEKRKLAKLAVIFVGSLYITTYLAYNHDFGFGETWYRYFATYSAGTVLFFSLTTFFKIKSRVFIFLGKISFSIYLLHSIILQIVSVVFHPQITSGIEALLWYGGAATASILLSIVTYYLVEKPFQGFGKKIIDFVQEERTVQLNM